MVPDFERIVFPRQEFYRKFTHYWDGRTAVIWNPALHAQDFNHTDLASRCGVSIYLRAR